MRFTMTHRVVKLDLVSPIDKSEFVIRQDYKGQ